MSAIVGQAVSPAQRIHRQLFQSSSGSGFFALFLLAASAFGAVDGTVTNKTVGKPQAGATVTLFKLGGAGMEAVESVKSDASGKYVMVQTSGGNKRAAVKTLSLIHI